jgi:glycosyltransferase involved in cell wall biosynthesis
LKNNVKLKWICELGTHYNDSLFNSLHRNNKLNLEVFYILEKLDSHPWKNNKRLYKFKYYKKIFFIDWRLFFQGLTERKTVWIIGGWFDLTSLLTILFRSFFKWNYIIWTDTPDTRARPKTIFNLFRNILLKYILNNASYVMGTGRQSIPSLNKLGARENKIVNMPYFIDTTLFNPLNESIFFANSPIVFLSAGRLINKIKGYDLAINALAKIKIKHPDFKFHYKIAGIGDDLDSLKNLVVELDLIDEVEFVGWLEANELPKFLQLGHYFLHPARYEPYGVSVLEAMAAGLIVIGSDSTGAVLDRIIVDYNGFIHSSGSSQSLYEQIEKTIILPHETKVAMRQNSYNLALEWDVKKGHDIIIKLIEEICVA